jgi:hypothetical protein
MAGGSHQRSSPSWKDLIRTGAPCFFRWDLVCVLSETGRAQLSKFGNGIRDLRTLC